MVIPEKVVEYNYTKFIHFNMVSNIDFYYTRGHYIYYK